ncbi:MAG: restriction endonuclease subunit S [Nitrospirota bacterium]|nr:restriction endonuclease subunit S [Nitrospirota bacterium]
MMAQRLLGEVADIVRGISFPKNAKSSEPRPGDVACLRTANVQREVDWVDLWYVPGEHVKREEQFIQLGDILVSTANSYELVGKVAPVGNLPQKATLGAFISLIRPRLGTDPKFLYHQLAWDKTQSRIRETASTTTNISNVSTTKLGNLELEFPELDQQRAIVAEIEKQFSRLDEAVASLKRTKANLKRYKASVLKAAVEGKLFGQSSNGTMSIDWGSKPISVAIDSLDQGWSPQCENEPSNRPSVWGIIKTTAVQSMRYLGAENKRLPDALSPRPHLELAAGDLLMTRAGPRARVGVTCLVKNTRPHLMLCDKVYRIRCKKDLVNPAFLELVLNAPNIVDELNQLKTGISDSGVNLTQKRLNELVVPLPALKVQKQIVAEVERRLSVIEELEASVEANLTRADRLRQSILSQAFSGRLLGRNARPIPDSLPPVSLAAESHADYGKTTVQDGHHR